MYQAYAVHVYVLQCYRALRQRTNKNLTWMLLTTFLTKFPCTRWAMFSKRRKRIKKVDGLKRCDTHLEHIRKAQRCKVGLKGPYSKRFIQPYLKSTLGKYHFKLPSSRKLPWYCSCLKEILEAFLFDMLGTPKERNTFQWIPSRRFSECG